MTVAGAAPASARSTPAQVASAQLRLRGQQLPDRARLVGRVAYAAPVRAATAAAGRPASHAIVEIPDQPGPGSRDIQCLTNDAAVCLSFDPYTIFGVVTGTVNTAILIWQFIKASKGGKGGGGQQGKSKSEGTKGGNDSNAGLCLADTTANGGNVFLTACGADGTVWIAIAHSNGYYLESRWWYDQGLYEELTTDPSENGNSVFVAPPANPGGSEWQTWSWYLP
jgi:hypothetical protein